MSSKDKTNVMRVLDSKKIAYGVHTYEPDGTLSGEEIARILNEDVSCVFKTLVTQGKTGAYYVFVVPVAAELDLKKAAKAAGEKSIEMIKQKDLLPLTGYIHGGCSPVGMKKLFPTFIHESAENMEKMYVSGGKVGYQIDVAPSALAGLIRGKFADIVG